MTVKRSIVGYRCDALLEKAFHSLRIDLSGVLQICENRLILESDFVQPVDDLQTPAETPLCPLRCMVVRVDGSWNEQLSTAQAVEVIHFNVQVQSIQLIVELIWWNIWFQSSSDTILTCTPAQIKAFSRMTVCSMF